MKKVKGVKFLFVNILAVCISATSLLGATFAWFNDGAKSGSNLIVAGNLDVVVDYTLDGEEWNELDGADDLFQNGLWEPGHTEVVALRIKNNGSLALKYTAKMNIVNEIVGKNASGEDIILSNILDVSTLVQQNNEVGEIALMLAFMSENFIAYENTAKLSESNVIRQDVQLLPKGEHYVIIKVDMPETIGNEANHNGTDVPSIELGIDVIARQMNYEKDTFGSDYDKDAEYPAQLDAWDGTADISWYDPTATEHSIDSAEALAGLANLVDGIDYEVAVEKGFVEAVATDVEIPETWNATFEGQTVYLNCDLDLYVIEGEEPKCFEPIGSYRFDKSFKGIFDGQGHTVSNLSQNTWALDNGYYYSDCGLGLFGQLEDAEVKNLTVDGADISGESAICGTIVATAHNTKFDNITVKNANVADYQYYAGGMIGWASGEIEVVNCNMEDSTNVAAQWGDFDNSIGGVIGGASKTSTILIKDTTVACRIDAYNDVTSSYQWYAYRRAGMLIGNSGATTTAEDGSTVADAPQLTCENVTVIYGEWANYTYCAFAGTSWPYVRVQAGVSNSAYSNPRYGHPVDANGNEVVDDNHVHNEGEDHHVLRVFDQLYGGGQGVYGNPSHIGVTVVYNNK